MKIALLTVLLSASTAAVVSCSSTQGGSNEAANGGASAGSSGMIAGNGAAAGAGGAGGTTASNGGVATTGTGGGVSSGGASATGAVTGAGGAQASGGTAGAGGPAGAGGSTAGGAGALGTGGAAGASAGSAGAAGAGGSTSAVGAPCDIYDTGNTPCVAAHSTVRALYGAYSGNLYQVRRASDRTTKDIRVQSAGGFADSVAQDEFCSGTSCTISMLYDQSPKGNHLKVAPGGGAVRTADKEVNANRLKLTVSGHPVYAAYFEGGMGYRNNATSGVATGDQPEGEYMVTSGKHFNNLCCFDYGNAETTNNDDGNGTMEAIYFGNCTSWGKGTGSGPWVMADLENGLFGGQSFAVNSANNPLTHDYVTAMIKGRPGRFAIKGGNAQTSTLKSMYDGARPTTAGYNPMHKQGAIILGIGGDNSNGSTGTFFEGCMTSGYPTDATEDAVQANIVAAGYGK